VGSTQHFTVSFKRREQGVLAASKTTGAASVVAAVE
jgi:trehalose-6-phosphate synthase